MADWTDVVPAPFGVSYFNSFVGIHSIGGATGSLGSPAFITYPASNRAIFVPFRLMTPTRIGKLWAVIGTASGNIDLGIYSWDGTNLASTGSTPQAIGYPRIIALATAIRLPPGLYYIAVSVNNTTSQLSRIALSAIFSSIVGMAEQASAFPLPNNATLATVTGAYLPHIGFISEEG